jgi:hypothetical protein
VRVLEKGRWPVDFRVDKMEIFRRNEPVGMGEKVENKRVAVGHRNGREREWS